MAIQPKGITTKMVEEQEAYYTVSWSRIAKVDKYQISGSVPAFSGIYEIYWMDEKGKLNYLSVAKTWYSGLRYALRTRTDPEMEQDPRRRKILDEHDCYYRYTAVSSTLDMDDLLFYFEQVHLPNRSAQRHSGRYLRIHVRQLSDDRIVTI